MWAFYYIIGATIRLAPRWKGPIGLSPDTKIHEAHHNPGREMRYELGLSLGMLLAGPLIAQDAADRLLQSRSEELLGTTSMAATPDSAVTSIADKTATSLREASAIVTVLTAEDLDAAGVRDIREAIQLLPGVALGRDVDDVVGVGVRGNWAEEAKCLFMLNGLPLNENSFGSMALGGRFPIEAIARIEFIGGPGSVQYGGAAALGVINIVTKEATGGEGVRLGFNTGVANGQSTRREFSICGVKRLGADADLLFAGRSHMGVLSTVTRTLPDGRVLNYGDSTRQLSNDLWLRLRKGGLTVDMAYDDFMFDVSDQPYEVVMRNAMLRAAYRMPLSRRTTLETRIGYRYQLPWINMNNVPEALLISNTVDQRVTGGLELAAKPFDMASIRAGVEAYDESSSLYYYHPGNVFVMSDARKVTLLDASAFAEAEVHGTWGRLTGGYRWEHHSFAGDFAAPRAAYVKTLGHFHLKLLYSEAFKIPTIQNINLGPEGGTLERERVVAKECEVGWQAAKGVDITANVFDQAIVDPIVYVLDEATEADNYLNRSCAGTWGLEGKARIRFHRASALLSYSNYFVKANSCLPETELPAEHADSYQGLPRQKATAVLAYRSASGWQPGCTIIWLDRAFAYTYRDEALEDLALQEFQPSLLLGIGLKRTFRHPEGLVMRLGCENLLDAGASILSPYNNGMLPLPYESRELTVSFSYNVPW